MQIQFIGRFSNGIEHDIEKGVLQGKQSGFRGFDRHYINIPRLTHRVHVTIFDQIRIKIWLRASNRFLTFKLRALLRSKLVPF